MSHRPATSRRSKFPVLCPVDSLHPLTSCHNQPEKPLWPAWKSRNPIPLKVAICQQKGIFEVAMKLDSLYTHPLPESADASGV